MVRDIGDRPAEAVCFGDMLGGPQCGIPIKENFGEAIQC